MNNKIILIIIILIVLIIIFFYLNKKIDFFKNSIPKTIYFCNKTLDKIKEYADNWKKLNPEYEIKLYDNKMCKEFLLNEYGQLYVDIFNYLTDGPIKADFWRVCILYKYGGVYSDIDNEPLVPLKDFIEPDIDFVTCSSYWDSMNFNFNPNFIISNKNNIILKNCIDWYINKYNKKDTYDYWDWSIMKAFTDILHLKNFTKEDAIYYQNNMKIQIIKECPGNNHYDAHNIYKNKRVFNNRYESWDFSSHSFK
jgi:hypothetical protein